MLISKEDQNYLNWDWIKDNLKKHSLCDFTNDLLDHIEFYKNIEEIEFHTHLVSQLKVLFETSSLLNRELSSCQFMEFSLYSFKENYIFSAQEIFQLYIFLTQIDLLKNDLFIETNKHSFENLILKKELLKFHSLKDLTQQIISSIDKNYNIKDTASHNLSIIRKSIGQTKNSIFDILKKKILFHPSYQEYIQEPLIIHRNGYYGIPTKKVDKKKISGILLDESKSTSFIHPSIITEENILLNRLYKREKSEIKLILKRISAMIIQNQDKILNNFKFFSYLNLSISKALFSIQFNGNLIQSNTKKKFNLIQAKHPILINQKKVTPIDILIPEEKDMLILSGINTGGKSLTLKTIGLFCLMNQAGLLCSVSKDSEIPVFQKIFIISGDPQNIYIHNSSFSGQLNQLKDYLHFVSKNNIPTLLLLDEPLSNTNPEESSALTIAFLYEFLKTNIKIILITHLKNILYHFFKKKYTLLAFFELDKNHQPNYKIIYNFFGKSQAIQIAKNLKTPHPIISRALKILKKKKDYQVQSIIQEKFLIKKKKEILKRAYKKYIEKKKETLKKLKEKIDQFILKKKEYKIEISRRKKSLFLKKRKYLLKWIQKLKRISNQSNQQLPHENTNKILEEAKHQFRKLETNIFKLGTEIKHHEKQKAIINQNISFKKGDIVFYIDAKKEAEILNIKGNTYWLKVSHFTIKTSLSQIIKIDPPKIEKNITLKHEIFLTNNSQKWIANDLNIRGITAHEALEKVKNYIEDLHLNSEKQGKIIHGKGKGILKELVHQFLRHCHYIESFELAPPNLGDYGVTLVYLKN